MNYARLASQVLLKRGKMHFKCHFLTSRGVLCLSIIRTICIVFKIAIIKQQNNLALSVKIQICSNICLNMY